MWIQLESRDEPSSSHCKKFVPGAAKKWAFPREAWEHGQFYAHTQPWACHSRLIADARRIVREEVARAAGRVVRIADLGCGGTLRPVIGTSLMVAVIGVSPIGEAASAASVTSQSFGGVMTSVAQIDVMAAGGGANKAKHERAEEASLHGR